MATGDAAAAAGMDTLTGDELANTLADEVNKTRDYIAEKTGGDTGTLGIPDGGTGATTASGARVNLGVQPTVDDVAGATAGATADKLVRYGTGGRINVGAPTFANNATTKDYVDDTVADLFPRSGGTVTGNMAVNGYIRIPNASAATSDYTVAYINGDGRISRGASSERYKKYISSIDPASLGNLFPDLVRYQMRNGDGSWKYGYIAEHLAESDDLRPFVVYAEIEGERVPDSIDFIALLMAQNAQQAQQIAALTTRLDDLEARS